MDAALPAPEDTYAQPKQVEYRPRSQGVSSKTLIPFNMVSAAQKALDRFEQRHGDIDQYLATRLGYASTQELHQYFSAEQVDASALAIDNLERGQGFITGDQTGIGKGRICASIMRYAQQQGQHAIFVTKLPTLYADMMRDVTDIGTHQFEPFATDNKIRIPLPNGGQLLTGPGPQQETAMREMMRSGDLNRYSAIFTTYSQLQTVGQKEPLRRDFLRELAPNAILILDEAHEAGGTKNDFKQKGQAPDRADFVRELIDLSAGVFYSSATYAKRPDVMDLYARRTDLNLAVSDTGALESILARGGVPLQQMVASKFVASGQMLRRERSYDGVSFQAKVVPVDHGVADEFATAMRGIKDFDQAKQMAVKELAKELKKEAKALSEDNAIGAAGAQSTNFTSLMHNCIEQGLLAQKAEATVQEAIDCLARGQKPVIAVANTMGSFIQGYAEAHDLQPGDALDLSFANLLERYLERSRDVVLRDYQGISERRPLTDLELGIGGALAYESALASIRESDFSTIPISPIDYIEQRLQLAGYRVAEVTGRKAGIDYASDGTTTYKVRAASETSPTAKIEAVAQFNAGEADVILLNCSGSTGISLHASEKFTDQRPRHMIVAQAERDINVFMQMLGRIHRTGQVELPSYTLLMGDLPAEKRPGAVLCRKMASLNANTTASRETDISLGNVVDFMNAYGEQVVKELLEDDPELNAALDYPTNKGENDSSDIALITRTTGAIPLLPMAQQEAVYDLIESEYLALVDQARSMGENILEADHLDLDARTTARMEAIPDDSPVQTEFTGPVYLEVIDTKNTSKPLTQLQVVNVLREELGLEPVETLDEQDPEHLQTLGQQRAEAAIAALTKATNPYRDAVAATKSEEAASKFSERIDKQLEHVGGALATFPVGTPVRIVSDASQNVFYGVVASVDQKVRSGSPAAPNTWKMRLLVADSARQITLPLSKINTNRFGGISMTAQAEDWFGNDVYALFDKFQQGGRIERQIFTGNIIKAFEKHPNGKLVNFTDHHGQVRQGLVMPKDFNILKALDKEPVAFKDGYQVKTFLTELTSRQGTVKILDELLTIKAQSGGGGFLLQVPKAKAAGGKYYLDEDLIAAAGTDFYSVGDRMEVVVPPERLEQTLAVLMHQRNYTLAAFSHREIARDYLGIKLPELEVVNDPPPSAAVSAPASPMSAALEIQHQTSLDLKAPAQPPSANHLPAPALPEVVGAQSIGFISEDMATLAYAYGSLSMLDRDIDELRAIFQSDSSEAQTRKDIAQLFDEVVPPDHLTAVVEAVLSDRARLESPTPPPAEPVRPINPHKAELARGEEVLRIAAQVYALAETQGNVQPDANLEMWTAQGKNYDVTFAPQTANFFVVGKNGNQMEAQSIEGELDPGCTSNVSTTDVERFQAIEQALARHSFERGQAPAETQALAQIKWEAAQESAAPPPIRPMVEPPAANARPESEQVSPNPLNPEISPGEPSRLDSLRQWYHQAQDLGRSEKHLEKIKALGIAAKAGNDGAFTAADAMAMERDRQAWQQQVATVAQQAQSILGAAGRTDATGIYFEGKTYAICQLVEGDVLSVRAENRGEILRIEGQNIQQSSITATDADRFRQFAQRVQQAAGSVQQPVAAGIER